SSRRSGRNSFAAITRWMTMFGYCRRRDTHPTTFRSASVIVTTTSLLLATSFIRRCKRVIRNYRCAPISIPNRLPRPGAAFLSDAATPTRFAAPRTFPHRRPPGLPVGAMAFGAIRYPDRPATQQTIRRSGPQLVGGKGSTSNKKSCAILDAEGEDNNDH